MMSSAENAIGSIGERDLDALREMANIGCGNAATALSKLVGGAQVLIDVPRVELADLAGVARLVGGPDCSTVGVALEVHGPLSGRLVLLMPLDDARELAGLLLGSPPRGDRLPEDAQSAICEAGNIVGSACLNAIGRALRMTLIPSVPEYTHDAAVRVIARVVGRDWSAESQAVVLETRFNATGDHGFTGHFLILPAMPSLRPMLKAMGL